MRQALRRSVDSTQDGSVKRVRICLECWTKMTGTPNNNELFSRLMRMLD